MEIEEIVVYKKSNKELITKIFEDDNGIKELTSDDVEVHIKLKDSSKDESY